MTFVRQSGTAKSEDDHGYHGFPNKIAISWGLSSHPQPISSPWSPLKKLHSTMTRALFHLVHEMWRSSHRLACQKGVEMGDLKDNCHFNLGKMTPVDLCVFFLQIHVIAMSCVIWRGRVHKHWLDGWSAFRDSKVRSEKSTALSFLHLSAP